MNDDFLFPTDGVFDVRRLCEAVETHRFTLLAAVASVVPNGGSAIEHPRDIFLRIAGMPPGRREFFLADPAFARWIDMTVVAIRGLPGSSASLQSQLKALPDLAERVERRLDGTDLVRAGRTGIAVQGAELDPIIKAATPPTYDFATDQEGRLFTSEDRELREFASEAGRAFENIEACDPSRHEALKHLIRIIGYLPDVSFRSCSAARFQGVIYLAGGEETIIDLEESIVHEGAHQLLYKLAELCPITTRDGAGKTYSLPWSGSERDLFGYYHAYFVYLQIVEYLDRRVQAAGSLRFVTARVRELIHRGLQVATPILAGEPGMTPYGRALFGALAERVAALRTDAALLVA